MRIPKLCAPVQTNHRIIPSGGVENAGNTCTSSVLLQEFFAFPDFYQPYLQTQLVKKEEENAEHYQGRVSLQAHLTTCVQELKDGRSVTQAQSAELTCLLMSLGWQNKMTSLHQWFYKLSPDYFPLPTAGPRHLYRFVLSMLAEPAVTENQIVLLEKTLGDSFQEAIVKSLPQVDTASRVLWRVAKDYQDYTPIEECFSTDGFVFTLKMILSYRNQRNGKHVVCYRKEQNGWVLCDDANVVKVQEVSPHSIYMALYESHFLQHPYEPFDGKS